MKELAEQAATGSYSTAQRAIMNSEYSQLALEMDRIAASTSFNDIQLLNGSATYKIHLGSTDTIDVVAEKMDSTSLGVTVGLGLKETYDNTRGVARADDSYLTAAEISGTADFNFKMVRVAVSSASAQISLDLSAYSAVGLSLNNLVDLINGAWGDALQTGTIAYAQYDEDTKQYRLRLENPVSGAYNMKVSAAGGIDILNDAAADFTNAVNGTAGTALTLTTTSGATSALAKLTSAIKTKDSYRAKLGYLMNRLESATSVINIQAENLEVAKSRISDVDVATEMAAMTRNQVLAQAGISMLTQANTMPQMALTLLRG
jgi:flagellin